MRSRYSEFFCICPLGAEKLLQSEIEEVLPFLISKDSREYIPAHRLPDQLFRIQGGVEVKLPLEVGLQLNFWLKISTRVLLRLGSFWAQEPWQFQRGFMRVLNDAKIYLSDVGFAAIKAGQVNWKISSKASKLGNEKFLLKLLQELSSAKSPKSHDKTKSSWGVGEPGGKECSPCLVVRGESDHFEVSIDTSGQPLFHRDEQRVLQSKAPLRENLGALVIRALKGQASLAKTLKMVLVDPFCGSGTLLFEAKNFLRPQLKRSFAFQQFIRTPKLLQSDCFFNNYASTRVQSRKAFGRILGFDLDAKAAIHKSLSIQTETSALRDQEIWATSDWQELNREVRRRIIKQGASGELGGEDKIAGLYSACEVWIATHPPYGVRLKALPPNEFIRSCLELEPSRVAWIAEETYSRSLLKLWPKREGWKFIKFPVLNQGLPCWVVVLQGLNRQPAETPRKTDAQCEIF